MNIVGINKTTLIDYPGKVATTLFTLGCNMSCPYCHNKQIAFDFAKPEILDLDYIFNTIEERVGFIDGISITGGEPTLQKDLPWFCKEIKKRFNLLVKVDTNGSFPMVVKRLIDENIVDYFAMDIKTSFKRYKEYLGIDGEIIYKTYDILRKSGVEYELRVTCYPDFVNSDTLSELLPRLDKKDRLYLQKCNVDYYNQEEIGEYDDKQLGLFEDMLLSKGFSSTNVRGLV
jgi:pyruvate formate lyase activating enzyme